MAEAQYSIRSKIFLAQHLVETQICTLSKIFLGQKVDPESRHVPVLPQTEEPPRAICTIFHIFMYLLRHNITVYSVIK